MPSLPATAFVACIYAARGIHDLLSAGPAGLEPVGTWSEAGRRPPADRQVRPLVGSARSAERAALDAVVAEHLTDHIQRYPVKFTLPDITNGERTVRPVELLFTTQQGKLLTDKYWAELWAGWREPAGWPKEGTFHSLRHFFATTLMSHGVEPQDVQKALRHANLRITLETYVHWLPKKDRPRGLVGDLLRRANEVRADGHDAQDQS